VPRQPSRERGLPLSLLYWRGMVDVREVGALDDILDRCIERLVALGETPEQCVSRHPDHGAYLKPLLETSLTVRKALAAQADSGYRGFWK
jgi:hypothetical protein